MFFFFQQTSVNARHPPARGGGEEEGARRRRRKTLLRKARGARDATRSRPIVGGSIEYRKAESEPPVTGIGPDPSTSLDERGDSLRAFIRTRVRFLLVSRSRSSFGDIVASHQHPLVSHADTDAATTGVRGERREWLSSGNSTVSARQLMVVIVAPTRRFDRALRSLLAFSFTSRYTLRAFNIVV